MFQRFKRLIATIQQYPASRHSSRRLPASLRLNLEVLEDRALPSNWMVWNTGDDLDQRGTLRYAVAHAASGDTIHLAANLRKSAIELTQGELLIDKDLSIRPVAKAPVTISGGGHSRVFEITGNAHVSLSNLTITGGNGVANNPGGTDAFEGGALLNWGALTINACTLTDNLVGPVNFGGSGAAIFNLGALTITDSRLVNNDAGPFGEGGAMTNIGGAVTISGSTISNNSAGDAGAMLNLFGTLAVESSTVSGNHAADFAGAILSDGTLTISNSVLSGNSASGTGGALSIFGGTATITACTLSGNSAASGGGAIFNENTLAINGSTFSSNSVGSATVSGKGGAIYNDISATVTVSQSSLSGNSATGPILGGIIPTGDGGAIFNRGAAMIGHS